MIKHELLDDFIDRHSKVVRAWLVLGPSLVGFYPLTGMINPFWGSLSGWPMYLAARGHPVYGPHPWYEVVAFFAGPVGMLAVKVVLSGLLLSWRSSWKGALVLLWAATAFAVVPFYSAPRLFPGWPVWCACE